MPRKKEATTFKFEVALKDLEKIVEKLEAGEIDLDDALKAYEDGVRLARECTEKLNVTKKKVELLIEEFDGTLHTEPFGDEEKEGAFPFTDYDDDDDE